VTPERWRRVNEVFRLARACAPERCAKVVAEACGGDEELRQQVEALLAADVEDGEFLDTPPLGATAVEGLWHGVAPPGGLDAPATGAAESLEGVVVAGNYELGALLGRGGMGAVYRARQRSLDREVAVKILRAEALAYPGARERFEREAKAVARLKHPNIVAVHDYGVAPEVGAFIVMELLTGRSLGEELERNGPMAIGSAVAVMRQVCAAVGAAHAAGVLHRDLKPDNVVLEPGEGSAVTAKVLDFGLAKLTDAASGPRPTLTKSGVIMGTPAYMSPEQCRGEALDARSDVYELGCVLYEMVTGRPPFVAETSFDVMTQHATVEPTPPSELTPQVPQPVEAAILKALAKRPEQRFESAAELGEALVASATPGAGRAGESAGGIGTRDGRRATMLSQPKRTLRPIALACVLVAALSVAGLLLWRARTGSVAVAPIKTIAVLPFKPLGQAERDQALELGMADTLIAKLSNSREVVVPPVSAVRRYGAADQDPQAAGRELGVEAVLDGYIQRRDDRIRVTARLLRVGDGEQLWAGQFDEKMTDIFAVQDSISEKVAAALALRLTGEERERLRKRYTENTEAYELYLRGRYFWSKRTSGDLQKAVEAFRQAIALDPNYALAYTGLADSYAALAVEEFGGGPPGEMMPKAKEAALRALEIDDTLAEAHTSLGRVLGRDGRDAEGGERELKRGIELDPNSSEGHRAYAMFLVRWGRFDEALVEIRRALASDPFSLHKNMELALIHYFRREYDAAVDQYEKTLELDPNYYQARFLLALAYMQKGRLDEAVAELQKAADISGRNPRVVAYLGYAYARASKRREAQNVLDELKARSANAYVSSYDFAIVYLGLGDRDRAFEWLEKTVPEHDDKLLFLKVEPVMDDLRSDPRFEDLVRRVGLVP
jgi:serine/threonine-protein kinase